MNRFEKIAKGIRKLCDEQGLDLSEAVIDLIAKDLLESKLFRNEITVDTVEQGGVFKWYGRDYIKLDTLTGCCLCLTKNVLFDSKFDDDTNNWRISQLRNDIKTEFIPDTEDLISFYRNLTTADGLTEYGNCMDRISMLTCDEYRKYRKFIPTTDVGYWTITADSPECSHNVRYVYSDGSLNNGSARYRCGVRPLICLDNGTLVEVKE